MEIVKMVLEKTKMLRFSPERKKPFQVILSIRSETFEIVCTPVRIVRPHVECVASFNEIKEIRPGKNSKDFESSVEGRNCNSANCFVLYYGTEFRLKTLSLCVESDKKTCEKSSEGTDENLIRNLMQGLQLLRQHSVTYPLKLEIWMRKCFQSMNMNEIITLKQMTNQYMHRISLKMPTEKLTELFEKYGDGLAYGIKFQGFSNLTTQVLHDQQIFTDCFGKYSLNAKQLSKDGFEEFQIREQEMTNSNIPPDILREYFKAESDGKYYLAIGKAVHSLFSKVNQVWDTKFDKVYQNMKHPLSHYWIASSHNTYLTGDQFASESSVEAYVRALRQGCRCVEIDCFDGSDGPEIYHGLTLTTKINFVDVLIAIRDHAFVVSEYPVIISIENHCSLKQQKIMAKKFIEIFGSMLVTEPLQEKETQLPSPEDLKRRIILKGRKLLTDETERLAEEQSTDTSPTDINICDAKKTGKMFMQNICSKWEPYFFALIGNKLEFTLIQPQNMYELERPENSVLVLNEELHFKEKWYHGEMPGGTKEAEKRVQAYDNEGCFLVRNSTNFPGEYSLCLLSQKRAYHFRIASKYDSSGQRLFYLNPNQTFDSLYLLITHYRRNSLDTQKFTIERFTVPVPPPDKHELESWFHKNLDRTGAENVLATVPITGAFLVRYAGDGGRFAISFRIDKLIKHCRINEDGRLLMVSSKKFENISELVKYYGEHTFYKWVKLNIPVTAEMRRISGDSANPTEVITHPGYLSVAETQVRAKRDCVADNPGTKISFKKGDVISNVEKFDGDFWKGDLGDQVQKLFPKDFVEVIEIPTSPFGSRQKGSVEIGEVQILPCADKNYPFILSIHAGTPAPFRAAVTSEQEAREWEAVINESQKEIKIPPKSKKSEKKSKIASELSQLIIYAATTTKPVPAEIRKTGRAYNRMASFSESVGEKLMYSHPSFFSWFTQVQLTRIFPKGQRIDSSNYNPITFWNVGTQLIALNYQTPEIYMQLNRGKFRQNGNCGYVLKPDCLLKDEFNPYDVKQLNTFEIKPLKLKLTVLSGRHVFRQGKGIMSPFVEIEVFGAPFDCQKVKTRTIVDNGLNPFWNSKFDLEIKNSQLALIRFSVQSEDMFGDPHFIGEVTYPVNCLLPGYRSVPLLNGYGEELLSVLLIHLKLDKGELNNL